MDQSSLHRLRHISSITESFGTREYDGIQWKSNEFLQYTSMLYNLRGVRRALSLSLKREIQNRCSKNSVLNFPSKWLWCSRG
ncbi:hypothetical protein QVD17_11649 [Tagetes erecta]|uniref:Uncharacterized protein n=1 Tax=Tagetes erecta TaxID=13708 RepID=A0AAD8KTV4_TARER|nr:hypothetical protein QVD17_11649 [Tagetes erecta]